MTITDYDVQPLPGHDLPEQEPELDTFHDDADDSDDADSYTDLPAAPGKARTSRGRARSAGKVTPRLIRSVLAKHAELAAASPADIQLLAAVLGVRDDVDDLVAHILSTPRLSLAGVTELASIVDASRTDPFEAMARAMQHENASKAIWAILTALGLVDGARPAKESEASVAIARAAASFTAEHTARLDTARALARKGN